MQQYREEENASTDLNTRKAGGSHWSPGEVRRLTFELGEKQREIERTEKIENALEKVRSQSLSMHRSEELQKQAWFDKCYQQDNAMKNALAISPATTLNIYTCAPSSGGGTLLGYAYLPNAFPESDPRHGVVLLYASLPGAGADPYDEGDTATHEIGHYLGLYHTFQNGCSTPGDSVDDTPYEASAAFGCPTGRDTCSQARLDPITNFMDYTDDPCMDRFSGNQPTRMQAITAQYKPSLGQWFLDRAAAAGAKSWAAATIGVQVLTSGATNVLKRILKQNGLEFPGDYKLLAVGGGNFNLAALTSGRIGATYLAVPLDLVAEQQGF